MVALMACCGADYGRYHGIGDSNTVGGNGQA
jgi:hypothetical protein